MATHSGGRVVVDECQATAVDGILSLGDISSRYQLKHVADHEAHVVQHNHLLHPGDPTRLSFGLSAREVVRGQYWFHPAMPEVVESALLNLQFD